MRTGRLICSAMNAKDIAEYEEEPMSDERGVDWGDGNTPRRPQGMTKMELRNSITIWSEKCMHLEEELASYKDALDVRLAGDGLIEFRGHYYKRIEEPIDG